MTANNMHEYESAHEEELSFKKVVLNLIFWYKVLISKWLMIAVFGLLGGGLGLIYAYIKKPLYTATTTFVLEDEKGGGGLGNLAGLASIAGVDLGAAGGGIFQGDNILQLYKSRTMLEKTLLTPIKLGDKSQLLIDRYIEFNKLRDNWRDRPELLNLHFRADTVDKVPYPQSLQRLRDSLLGSIVTDLNKVSLVVAKPDKKVGMIQVDVKSKDELFAKAFNDELVRNVNEFYILTKTKKTLQNVLILQHKTDSVRGVMNGAIYKAVQVSDATPNLNPTRQIQRVAPAQKAQFSAETNKAILSEMVKNLEMTKMSLLKETPLVQIIDRPVYPLFKQRTGKVKAILIGMFIFSILASATIILRKVLSDLLIQTN